MRKVVLKPGREKSLLTNRHPWIFSGAVEQFPSMEHGEVVAVVSHEGKFLAQAYFHTTNSLAGRVLSFDSGMSLGQIIESSLQKAYALRQRFIDFSQTDCYRLVNAEADGLPGLIVDCYKDVFVIQVNTCGMERLKSLLVEKLISLFHPRCIYEKSNSSARVQEGLPLFEGYLYGEKVEEVQVKENSIFFSISLQESQKTGFFLDQREMRSFIGRHAKGQRVLNCFAYTGGFSLYALCGGASFVESVDVSRSACEQSLKNTEINSIDKALHKITKADVIDYLKKQKELDFSLIILDPPAFAKQRKDVRAASISYKNLNREVYKKAKPGTLLLTSSCSYFMDRDLFEQILFQAASEEKREVKILSRHLSAFDHPRSLYHPEGDYLKSLLLYID